MKINALKVAIWLVLGIVLVRSCRPPVHPRAPLETLNVKPGNTAVLDVSFRKGTISVKSALGEKRSSPQSVTGFRRGDLVIKNNAEKGTTVEFFPQTKGFTFEPGIVAGYGKKFIGGFDVQFAYWKNWGSHCGIIVGDDRRIKGFVGLSCLLLRGYTSSLSLLGGIDSDTKGLVALRLAL